MRYVLSVLLLFCLTITTYADSVNSLVLTDAEMQKLKKYFPTDDVDHLIWKGDPITVSIPINKEKRLIFPDAITVDVKGALTADQLRVLNNNKALYLTALKGFSQTRIYVTLKTSGEVILIDLVTDEKASNTTQQITLKENNSPKAAGMTSSIAENKSSQDDMSFVDLIRFAWQAVYAPERLIQHASMFTRAPMHTTKFVSNLVYGDKVIAYPVSSWVSDDHYVTSVLIRNKYQHDTLVDIHKDLCGDWQAGAIFPTPNLKSYGDKTGDSVMLFLVSNRTFGETMGVCHGNA